jgi:hypothetical protein
VYLRRDRRPPGLLARHCGNACALESRDKDGFCSAMLADLRHLGACHLEWLNVLGTYGMDLRKWGSKEL